MRQSRKSSKILFSKSSLVVIGYYDRVTRALVDVPLERMPFAPGKGFAFEVEAVKGAVHFIPYHRVRKVWRNGELIWHRQPQ